MHHHDQGPNAEGHGHSLVGDIAVMRTLLARRDALKWFAGTGHQY